MIVSITVLLAVKLWPKSKNESKIKCSLQKKFKILYKINKKPYFTQNKLKLSMIESRRGQFWFTKPFSVTILEIKATLFY